MSADLTERRPAVVVVGGFLGAGKTTLILAAARELERRGLRSAVILNDQGDELVDTRLARRQGMHSGEVTGGCFCCRFSALAAVLDELRAFAPAVIFAEPVGSCTDIAATVLAPLREEFDRYRLAPFTVLVDPARAEELLGADADPDMAFLFEQQLREADLVCMTKADLYADAAAIPGVPLRRLSANSSADVAAWLDEVIHSEAAPGHKTLTIDYARYAEAEAALAWLNLSLEFEPAAPLSPAMVVGPFLDALDAALTSAGVQIVHLKFFDSSPAGWLKAAQCANGESPRVEGHLDASPASHHELLLNLRAKGDPLRVRKIVEEQLRALDGAQIKLRIECFSPAPPQPERRILASVAV